MADGLDVVAVRVEDVGAVVVLVVDRARTGRFVVDSAGGQSRLVEGVDNVPRVASKGDVNLGYSRPSGLEPEERLAGTSESGRESGRLPDQLNIQRRECFGVETLLRS